MGRYPRLNHTWLGFGHTIPHGTDGILYKLKFTATALLKSKTLPPGFQTIPNKKRAIELFLLFPLFQSELEYKKSHGMESLINLFRKKKIDDIINVKRVNACHKSAKNIPRGPE